MKQHITVEQLEELNSDDKVCRLNTLMGHEWDLTEEEFRKYSWNKILEDTAKYCTIGKMIEILNKKATAMTFFTQPPLNEKWEVKVKTENKFIIISSEELCDALWKVIKEVL